MAFGRAKLQAVPMIAFAAAAELAAPAAGTGRSALGLVPLLAPLPMAIGYSVVVGWPPQSMLVGAFTGSVLSRTGVDAFSALFTRKSPLPEATRLGKWRPWC